MKKLVKVVTMIMILATVGGVLTLFSACKKEPEKPVYEIKLYDDNWVELKKDSYGKNDTYFNIYKYDYDGEIKCFNAIAFRNGVEFFRFDYTKQESFDAMIIDLSINNYGGDYMQFPQKKGEYYLRYTFTFRSAYGKPQVFEGEDFPSTLIQSVIINII